MDYFYFTFGNMGFSEVLVRYYGLFLLLESICFFAKLILAFQIPIQNTYY